MPPTVAETLYPKTRAAWRRWLLRHHAMKREVWLIYFKKGTGQPSVPYVEAVEEALCFGWIDSTTKTLDEARYIQRFTPRKKGSNWSAPNLERVRRLVAAGLMTPAGAVHLPSPRAAKAFQAKHQRRLTGSTTAPSDLARPLRVNEQARAHWRILTPGYRRLFVRWITDARREETRAKRVAATVTKLARGLKHPMD
jgi:uncharacterized protein YdeI (YjbR/CyaY-like superfamily)